MTEILEAPPAPCVPQLDEETRRVLATAKGKLVANWNGQHYCILNALSDTRSELFLGSDDAHAGVCRDFAALGFRNMIDGWRWNDSHTKAEVIALFDKALTGA